MDDVQTDIAAIRNDIGTLSDMIGSIQSRNLDMSYRIDSIGAEVASISPTSCSNIFYTAEGKLNLRQAVMEILQDLGIVNEDWEYTPPSGIQISDEAFFKLVEGRT